MAITRLMREINDLNEGGMAIDEISKKFDISEGSVRKKIIKYKRAMAMVEQTQLHPEIRSEAHAKLLSWTDENIKTSLERYISENGTMPTAQDFDECPYLPSARQIQRRFGGVISLRKQLGYGDIDFTKGELRRTIAKAGNLRGIDAEDLLEPLLYEKYGEPFVHVQKRYYKGSKNRYDFFVYAKGNSFGIDVFTTDRPKYIGKNLRHKIERYKFAPSSLPIYFVLVGEFTEEQLRTASNSIDSLNQYPNMLPILLNDFLKLIESHQSLELPEGIVNVDIYDTHDETNN